MKRDFSETAEQDLYKQIDEINDEQWANWTDGIGDFFTWGLNIQDYLDEVNTYHKKIMDKNNTTKSEIQKIFSDVRTVDASYSSIFQKCLNNVKEQKEYVQKLIDSISTSPSNFTATGIAKLMLPANKELSDSKIQYYRDKLKFGNGDCNYDFDYIKQVMNKKAVDVPEELYAAMVYEFQNMSVDEKEKFIESSYILGNFWPDTSGNIGSGKHEYIVSDVLDVLVMSYGKMLEGQLFDLRYRNDVQKQILGNYSLLRGVCEQSHSVYVGGFYFAGIETVHDIDLTLEEHKYENDYHLKFNGSSSPYNERGQTNYCNHEIYTYGMKDELSIDSVFDDHVINLSETLRVNIDQKQFETVASGVADLLLGFVDIPVLVSTTMTAGKTMTDCMMVEVDGNVINSTVDKMQTLIIDANMYSALGVNACFSISDGNYQIYMFTVDEKELNYKLDKYSKETDNTLDFAADDVVNSMQNGTVDELVGLDEFVDWYTHNNGKTLTD